MHQTRLPNRLQGYDYSRNALYFVTLCVHDRVDCLGEIKDDQMFANEYGKIAEQQWQWLEQQYPYVVLHSFVVMPNHIHGIVEINDHMVGTGRDLSLQQQQRKIKSLSELMGAYKTTTSKQIHLSGLTVFKWQRSFHDHIIRNEESYERISNYIQKNPSNWKGDKFYSR
ncbi:transposase [Segetibacter aerophilus]|uniref:Transposase IS200-like domain-containing protein n=1 Tax=Segetibacter aerophilus TaxID=670293 RepID=A0A512BJR2_9BACT|nr:transposase [Segetibacter aerophilus]GEO12202.1 hypothetical protein SAE01_46980 [Segetibacter aerophilus]